MNLDFSQFSKRDNWLVLAVYAVTVAVFYPVFNWLLTQTTAHEQLTHAFLVLAFTGILIVLQNRIRMKLRFTFTPMAQALLMAAYALIVVTVLIGFNPLILPALSLVVCSMLLWVFGPERRRLIFSLMGAFILFTSFALVLPFLDWPLRSVAGQCAVYGLGAIGQDAQLGLLAREEPMLILVTAGRPFHVAAECNGFGILTSAILMALLLVLYFKSSWPRKLLSIVTAVAIGLLFNAIRIVVIILLAPRLPDEQYMLMHEIVGLVTTYTALGILYVVVSKWMGQQSHPEPAEGSATPVQTPA